MLNRNWQAINIRTPAGPFCQMATNAATALDIELGDSARAEALRPVKWDEWITLPVRDGDHAVCGGAVQAHFVGRCSKGSFTAVQELFARDEAGVSRIVTLHAAVLPG